MPTRYTYEDCGPNSLGWRFIAYDPSVGGKYATNNEGDGLFFIRDGKIQQHLGNGQFHADTLAQFREKFRRYANARGTLG